MPTVVHGDFEWDADKADLNVAKHGVTFEEAIAAMLDPLAIDFDDLTFPENLVTLAASPRGAILYVITTERGDRVRVISARRATNHERQIYEEGD